MIQTVSPEAKGYRGQVAQGSRKAICRIIQGHCPQAVHLGLGGAGPEKGATTSASGPGGDGMHRGGLC